MRRPKVGCQVVGGGAQMDQNEVRTAEAKVVALWSKVFTASNMVIRQVTHFGFEEMHEAVPSLDEVVRHLSLVEGAINGLIGGNYAWELERSLHNAKEQLARMHRMADALRAGDREEFEATFARLEKQLVC